MLDSQFFRFDGTSLIECQDSVSETRLAVADSFLVEAGRVRSLAAHEHRFSQWVAASSPAMSAQLDAFFAAVRAAIPQTGRWFPRIELHISDGSDAHLLGDSLFLRLRTAPAQLGEIALWTLDEPDPRLHPDVKGPDLSLCMQLRRKAQLHGADEAVILDESGFLTEGALSSIVWWRGEVLCAPDRQNIWLASITRDEIFEIARSLGYQTRLEHVKPSDLVGLEIWALSSLQGIRAVSDWVNLGSPVGKSTHIDKFQKRLRLLGSAIG